MPQAPLLRVEKNGGLPRQPAAVWVPAGLAGNLGAPPPVPIREPSTLAGVRGERHCQVLNLAPHAPELQDRAQGPYYRGGDVGPGVVVNRHHSFRPIWEGWERPCAALPDLEGCLVRHLLHHEGGQGVVDNPTHDSPRVPSALGELPPGGLPTQRAGIHPPVDGTCAAVPRKRPALT